VPVRSGVDRTYYFVQEPGGADDGPYVLTEIRRRLNLGLLTKNATLCRVGETEYMPVIHERFASVMNAPPPVPTRAPKGTQQTPIVPAATIPSIAAPEVEIDIPITTEIGRPSTPSVFAPPPTPSGLAPPTPSGFAPPTPSGFAPTPSGFAPTPSVFAPLTPSGFAAPQPSGFAPPTPSGFAPTTPSVFAPPTPSVFAPPPSELDPIDADHTARIQPITLEAVPIEMALQVYTPPPSPPALTPQPPPAPIAPPLAVAPPKSPRPPLSKNVRIGLAAGGAAIAIAIVSLAALRGGDDRVAAKDAMVRVTTASGTGAGFLIDGPDEYVYVATANHVVDRGERVLIERDVGSEKKAYVEAFPETEIVANDPDADLAIIRIKNVEASRFARLPLAKEPKKDAKILSYGYPGSSLAKHAGLISKDGKVLSLVSFPAYDERYSRILRENAVDGLLISTDIEPGFSGGPTLNEAGEVVGVNVTKDRAHVGQNGAVSVTALRELVKRIKPANAKIEPTPAEVVALLDKIQSEYLLLPLEERSKVRETDFVNRADLPALRRLVGEVRREERNTDTSFIAKYKLSGQAALGIYFARLPGKLLETYRSPTTTAPLITCELRNQHLTSFLGDLTPSAEARGDSRAKDLASCDELAVRPLAWDLVAATMQWDGKEKKYTVTKLDRMDDEGRVYRASVRIAGASNLIELWIGADSQGARLKLFDPTNNLYAIKSPRTSSATAMQGTWTMSRPRVTDAVNKEAEIESVETLSISIDNERKVSLRYVVNERYFSAGSKGKRFRCNGKATIETGLLQSFTGTLDNGVVVALPEKDAETIGADSSYCDPSHRADRIVAAKMQGEQLVLYRTDGNAYPETITLTKQP
jgi:S1-C subfamily serine protease